MDNQEAIKILDNLKPGDYSNPYEKGEAIVMAISALQEQEEKTQLSAEGTTSDLISRQDEIFTLCSECQCRRIPCANYPCGSVKTLLMRLPSTPPEPLVKESRTLVKDLVKEPCEDAVSREAAIDVAENAFVRGLLASPDIRRLPSAQPQYEELTPEEAASEIASGSIMSASYWLDAMIRLKQMGYAICRKR